MNPTKRQTPCRLCGLPMGTDNWKKQTCQTCRSQGRPNANDKVNLQLEDTLDALLDLKTLAKETSPVLCEAVDRAYGDLLTAWSGSKEVGVR